MADRGENISWPLLKTSLVIGMLGLAGASIVIVVIKNDFPVVPLGTNFYDVSKNLGFPDSINADCVRGVTSARYHKGNALTGYLIYSVDVNTSGLIVSFKKDTF